MNAGRHCRNGQVRTECPACRHDTLEAIGQIPYAERVTFAGVPIHLTLQPSLAECRRCRSWFTQNVLDEASALALYADGQGPAHWSTPPFAQSKTPDLVARVRGLVRRGSTVVDFGCNTGELLDFCREVGASRTIGIEASLVARQICLSKGHAIAEGLSEFSQELDVIFAFDLVEHLYDLPAFVDAARKALRRGGVLCVLTGCIESMTARRFRERWWYVGYPEHVLFPSWRYWRSLPGFRADRWRTYASVGYRPTLLRRLQGIAWTTVGRGRGLPLTGPDHHLVMLSRT